MQPAKLNNEYFKVPQSELRISIQLAASALLLGCVPKSIMVETSMSPHTHGIQSTFSEQLLYTNNISYCRFFQRTSSE